MATKLKEVSLTSNNLQDQQILMEAGELRANEQHNNSHTKKKGILSRAWARYVNNDHNWLDKQRGILILCALVVAGMAFHSGISPPGGNILDSKNGRYELGNAVQTEVDMDQFISFVTYNTFTMIISLGIVLVLISGFQMRNKFWMWVLTIATLFALVFMVATYLQSLAMMAPDMYVDVTSVIICLIWMLACGVMALVHTIFFVVWVVMKLAKKKMPEIE
uniref:uncharacterized protein LOC122579347 n=1 Tax=Erigeron canadensis TaxID=72917 RepID=UPI001CB919CE|nr:uncharacterized protein LOC122579347 [Erigeron canadensis]